MVNYPYTLNPNHLTEFLKHIQKAGEPDKVSKEYLIKAGFKSSNDRNIIPVLKFIGFLDSSGVPTDKYKEFRDTTRGPTALGACVRSSYSDLFQMYPDAYEKDTEALRNFFTGHTKGGEAVLSATVSTFKSLCSMARFDRGTDVASMEVPNKTKPQTSLMHKGIESLVINIQLTLPATSDGKIYEEFFKAMKKHLLEGKE